MDTQEESAAIAADPPGVVHDDLESLAFLTGILRPGHICAMLIRNNATEPIILASRAYATSDANWGHLGHDLMTFTLIAIT